VGASEGTAALGGAATAVLDEPDVPLAALAGTRPSAAPFADGRLSAA